MENNYRIKITNGDSEIEIQGDKEFVLEMLKKYENKILNKSEHPKAPISQSKDVSNDTQDPSKVLSVGEFIRKINSKKHVDFVLAFGYFLEKNQGISSFTPADINNCYYDSKLESSNTSQMIILNIRRGYFMEAKQEKGDSKKRYTLTSSGEEYVKQLFSESQS